MWTKFRNALFAPTDIAGLVFFRIAFGIFGIAEGFMGLLNPELNEAYEAATRFKYSFFEWVEPPLPFPWMYVLYGTFLILGGFIMVGRYYKVCTLLFAVGFSYSFLLTKSWYLNHGYLFAFLCFLMFFLPAHRRFSLDSQYNPKLRSDTIAAWQAFILPLFMGVVYFYGGIAKVQLDWLDAKPLRIWLTAKSYSHFMGELLRQKELAYFMAWGGIVLDFSAPFLLLWKRTRKLILVGILFFHVTNTLIFKIGIFPWMSICLSLMYFPPNWPRKLLYRIRPEFKNIPFLENYIPPPLFKQKRILFGLSLIMAYHLLMPFRHHLIEGDVNWTEEGHRFSWRMMLRAKQGRGYFELKSNALDSMWTVRPEEFLTTR
ncbi:MAG: HTTM domain-containing protein, partial [Bacteroidota bacterium]